MRSFLPQLYLRILRYRSECSILHSNRHDFLHLSSRLIFIFALPLLQQILIDGSRSFLLSRSLLCQELAGRCRTILSCYFLCNYSGIFLYSSNLLARHIQGLWHANRDVFITVVFGARLQDVAVIVEAV